MGKQIWKPGNMLYPLPVVLVTVKGKDGRENVLTVAWAGTICTNPPMVSISVRKERHSWQMLKDSKEFVINLTTKDMVRATDYCGVVSGRDVDKFAKCHLHRMPAREVKAPLLEESPVNIECRVVQVESLGSHDMFMAKVVCVHAEEKYMDERGRFDLSKADPLVYSHGSYYALGKQMGTFGYSVRKKKSANKASGKKK